ncbi:unnamed protein product [Protopolystoma xenopodis]|uniref:Uncharacterized protein n=1 Tax=Protopolystoma xenopodis TaxID=117903 RepID=A0A3S4ZBD4_9PLAT|nr:unnamed protein product [Protopolystoma xenopodis]
MQDDVEIDRIRQKARNMTKNFLDDVDSARARAKERDEATIKYIDDLLVSGDIDACGYKCMRANDCRLAITASRNAKLCSFDSKIPHIHPALTSFRGSTSKILDSLRVNRFARPLRLGHVRGYRSEQNAIGPGGRENMYRPDVDRVGSQLGPTTIKSHASSVGILLISNAFRRCTSGTDQAVLSVSDASQLQAVSIDGAFQSLLDIATGLETALLVSR